MATTVTEAKTVAEVDSLDFVTLTVTIVETPGFRVRRWLAVRLMALAGLLLGCDVEFVAAARSLRRSMEPDEKEAER